MRRLALLGMGVCCLLLAARSEAYETSRRGFILGLGLGCGWSTRRDANAFESTSQSGYGPALSFRIGAGLSERLLVYGCTRGVFAGDAYTGFTHSMTTAAVAFYLQPESPSVFFAGEIGRGSFTPAYSSRVLSGLGFGIGAGYEFAKHLSVEVDCLRTSLGEQPGQVPSLNLDRSVYSVALVLCWLGY